MTVKEIFDLRKQGRIEEAYDAIRPMYAAHKGKYTTLCMFWTARDIFNLRIQQGRFEEAENIFKALQRVLPNITDNDGRAAAFMQYAVRRLAATVPASSVLSGSPAEAGSSAATVPVASPAVLPAPTASPAPVASSVLSGSPAEKLLPGQQAVLDCIRTTPGLRVPKLSELTNIPSKSIERHISVLIERGLIEHRGSKKTGGYYVK